MSLDNCRRCNRVFARNLSPLCQDCLSYEQQVNMEVYRFVQSNPGTTMQEIADQFGMPLKDVEALVFSGALGTANQLIVTKCARCKCDMTFVNRVGYFCYGCNQFMEKESGRLPEDQKKIQDILSRERDVADQVSDPIVCKLPANRNQSKKAPPTKKFMAKYGFKRSNGKPSLQ